jgi:hypothetical protein
MGLPYSFLMPRASLPLMPRNTDVDDSGGDDQPKLTFLQRLRYTMVKPDDDGRVKDDGPQLSRQELEATIARADDKERNIGLVAAPIGAIVGLILSDHLVNNARSLGESTTIYQELTFVLMGLVALILALAWFRKRLFLGIATALLGLDLFNLHGYGFAVPFLLAGAWYLVRAYRLQQKLKLAGGGSGRRDGSPNSKVSPNRMPSAGGVLPRPNKRYTPPTEKLRRPSKAKPEA